jgi:hypothetical protein
MSATGHPVAYRLARYVDRPSRLLATVMVLPLVDGVFVALLVTGTLDSVAGILQVGLLVFGGSATVAVVLAEMQGPPRADAETVLAIGAPLVALASVEAALAPMIGGLLDQVIFTRFAAVIILMVAARTVSDRVDEYLPSSALVLGLGLLASFRPDGAVALSVATPEMVLRGTAAAGVGVTLALVVALAGPALRRRVVLDRFRWGSAVALALLAAAIVGAPVGHAPLVALGLTALLSLDYGVLGGAEPATPPVRADGDGECEERPRRVRGRPR